MLTQLGTTRAHAAILRTQALGYTRSIPVGQGAPLIELAPTLELCASELSVIQMGCIQPKRARQARLR